jgi:chemotaxis signal transduction protein
MSDRTGNEDLARLAEAATRSESKVTAADEGTTPMLVVRVGTRWLAVATDSALEIVLKGEVTSVPAGPHHVLGVTLIRGRLVAVVAVDEMLGLTPASDPVQTLPRLVVLSGGDTEIAIVADEIRGILDIPTPRLGEDARTGDRNSFIAAEVELGKSLVCILDVERFVEAAIHGESIQ